MQFIRTVEEFDGGRVVTVTKYLDVGFRVMRIIIIGNLFDPLINISSFLPLKYNICNEHNNTKYCFTCFQGFVVLYNIGA